MVTQALHYWRQSLLSQELILYFDHEAPKYVYSQKKLNAKHGQWIELLQDYISALRHKAGVENKIIDALSGNVFVLIKISTVVNGFEKMKIEYKSCPDFGEVYALLTNGTTHEIDGYILQYGFLLLGHNLCIL